MKFKTLENKNIVDIIEYINKTTNNPLYLDNTLVSMVELNSISKYQVNTEKTLTIIDSEYGTTDIPLNDKGLQIYSEDDMLIILYSFSELKGFRTFNILIFRIKEDILSNIMKIIQIEKNNK